MTHDFNRVELIGNLGKDPDLRYVGESRALARFSLATQRPARSEQQAETDWHHLVCWGDRAEFAAKYLTKGRRVFAAGRLTYQRWETADGKTVERAEIEVNELLPLDRPTAQADEDDVPF